MFRISVSQLTLTPEDALEMEGATVPLSLNGEGEGRVFCLVKKKKKKKVDLGLGKALSSACFFAKRWAN